MNINEQIRIVKKLLEATKELDAEFQEGWDEEIEEGEKLLLYLYRELDLLKNGISGAKEEDNGK